MGGHVDRGWHVPVWVSTDYNRLQDVQRGSSLSDQLMVFPPRPSLRACPAQTLCDRRPLNWDKLPWQMFEIGTRTGPCITLCPSVRRQAPEQLPPVEGATMHRVYGFVLLIAGIGFILLNAYLLCTRSFWNWEGTLLVAGACMFGYLLATAGYRMPRGNRF